MPTLDASASIVAAASLAADLTIGTMLAVGSITASASLASDGIASTNHLRTGEVAAAASLAADGHRLWQAAGLVLTEVRLDAMLSAGHLVQGAVAAVASLRADPYVEGQGLLVRDAVLEALRTLEEGCGCDLNSVGGCLRSDIINQVNACLQLIYGRAEQLHYFNRRTVTLTFAAAATSQAFDAGVQGLHGPVRLDSPRIILREVTDRAQFERYTETFYGADVPDGPRAFHLESSHYAGSDSVALTLHITPAPDAETAILADVITEPPRYMWADVTLGTPLSLPHKYAETLFLPLIRDWATSHARFTNREVLPQIQSQAATARQMLGLLDTKKPKGPREAAVVSPA